MLKKLIKDLFVPGPDMAFWGAIAIVTQEAYEKCLADQASDPANAPGCAVVFDAITTIKEEFLFSTEMTLRMKDEICN